MWSESLNDQIPNPFQSSLNSWSKNIPNYYEMQGKHSVQTFVAKKYEETHQVSK